MIVAPAVGNTRFKSWCSLNPVPTLSACVTVSATIWIDKVAVPVNWKRAPVPHRDGAN